MREGLFFQITVECGKPMQKLRRPGRPQGSQSKYKTLASDIASKVASGEFALGQSLPTVRQLSKSYDVGLSTVSQALKVLQLEGTITTSPRHRPVASMGFSLAKVLGNSIGVVFPSDLAVVLKDEYWQGAMYHGIVKANANPSVTLAGKRWLKDFPAGLMHLPLQGLLLVGCALKPHLFKQYTMLNAHFPVVTLDEPSEFLHSVSLDNVEAFRDATLRLIRLGHRQIAFIRPLRFVTNVRNIASVSQQRGEAFATACQEAGLTPSQFKIFSAGNVARGTIRNIVRAAPRFTAILTTDEDHAEQVEIEAELAGMRIPQDVSIVTLCNHLPSRWTGPVINFEDLGMMGVELLRSKPGKLQNVRVLAGWNEGETVAQPPGAL